MIISTPSIFPARFTIAFPLAPLPPPPVKLTVGGPHKIGPILQVSSNTELKSKLKSKLFGSTTFLAFSDISFVLLKILLKSKVDFVPDAPPQELHFVFSGQADCSSHKKNPRI